MSGTNSTSGRFKVRISDLPLGLYGVRFTQNTTTQVNFDYIDIITPIHSAKSNLNYDLQNTLPVGSQGISDNRKTAAVDNVSTTKAWAQAIGITSNPTTSSSSHVPCPDMSLTIKTSGGAIEVNFNGVFYTNSTNTNAGAQIYVNGSPVGQQMSGQTVTASNTVFNISNSVIVPLPAGTHKIDVYWVAGGGSTATAQSTYRILRAKEI